MKTQNRSNWPTIVLAAITLVFMFAANSLSFANTTYSVGDKIEVEYSKSRYKAKILEVQSGKYKIHYDGYGNTWDEWVTPPRMRPIGGKSTVDNQNYAADQNQADGNKKSATENKATAGITQLAPGTAWNLRLYRKSKGYSGDGTVQTMLFCQDGTWDTVRYGFGSAGAVGQRGTYKMTGKNLALKNGQSGQTESYSTTNLDAGTFELNDGSDIIWRLFKGVKTDCK